MQLTKRVGELQQYSRLNNVELKGVPEATDEDCVTIVQLIREKVGCPLTADDFDVVHRVPTKTDLNIIASFRSRAKKTEFATKGKKTRISTDAISFGSMDVKPVLINEHLTPDNKELFRKDRALKKGKEWKFLWVANANGHIKARKQQESPVFHIPSIEDFAAFI